MKLFDKFKSWVFPKLSPVVQARENQLVLDWVAEMGINAVNNAVIASQNGEIRDGQFSQYISCLTAYLSSMIDWNRLAWEDGDTLRALGFRVWDDEAEDEFLWLVPVWLAPHIPEHFQLTDIYGRKHSWRGIEFEEADARFGCIAYGIVKPKSLRLAEDGETLIPN